FAPVPADRGTEPSTPRTCGAAATGPADATAATIHAASQIQLLRYLVTPVSLRSGVQAFGRSGPAKSKASPSLSTLNARTPERLNTPSDFPPGRRAGVALEGVPHGPRPFRPGHPHLDLIRKPQRPRLLHRLPVDPHLG